MLAHLCMHPKATFFAFPHPTMIGPTRLPRQVEAEIYPKKIHKKVCKILRHSEGGILVAHGGLTRMTCGFTVLTTERGSWGKPVPLGHVP
jgi:hypothetical protein